MRDPRALISTSELTSHLGDPSLRVYDCTTKTVPPPPGSDVPYVAVPGLAEFVAAHIPGADFLDIQGEFSDQSTKLRFMMPPIPQLEAAFGRHGLGPGTRVVHARLVGKAMEKQHARPAGLDQHRCTRSPAR